MGISICQICKHPVKMLKDKEEEEEEILF